MSDKIEISIKHFEKLEEAYTNFHIYSKIELSSKKITELRKKITEEKKDGFTHLLRIITYYTLLLLF